MSIFQQETGEPSSNLAKGIDKEKQLAQELQIQNPEATVKRTSKTCDGGKDIIVQKSEDITYYEVKNWDRPMSIHDVQPYLNQHKISSAKMKIFNEGGFSNAARQASEDIEVKLIDGGEYQSPGLSQTFRWFANRNVNRVESAFSWANKTISENTRLEGVVTNSSPSRGGMSLIDRIVQKGEQVRKRLTIRNLALLGMIVAPLWALYRWRNDEYTRLDLLQPAILFLMSLFVYQLRDE